MNKQIKGIFIGIGLVTIAFSIYSFISGEKWESLSGILIGLSLIVLAYYDNQKRKKTQDKA